MQVWLGQHIYTECQTLVSIHVLHSIGTSNTLLTYFSACTWNCRGSQCANVNIHINVRTFGCLLALAFAQSTEAGRQSNTALYTSEVMLWTTNLWFPMPGIHRAATWLTPLGRWGWDCQGLVPDLHPKPTMAHTAALRPKCHAFFVSGLFKICLNVFEGPTKSWDKLQLTCSTVEDCYTGL